MIRIVKLTLVVAVVALAACAAPPTERQLNYLGSALTKVSAAVDVTVRYASPAEGLPEDQLLWLSTAHDPDLLKPFQGMTVRVLRAGVNSAVLVCRNDDGAALLEDAGCTAKLDGQRWNSGSTQSCDFTLDLKTICAQ